MQPKILLYSKFSTTNSREHITDFKAQKIAQISPKICKIAKKKLKTRKKRFQTKNNKYHVFLAGASSTGQVWENPQIQMTPIILDNQLEGSDFI
jgi:hypothetical protein